MVPNLSATCFLFIYLRLYIYSIFKFKIFSGLSFYCCTEQKLSVIPWCTLRVRKDPRFLLFRQHIGCWTVQRPGGVLWPPGLESAARDRTKDALSYRQDYRSSFKYDLRCGVSPGMRRIHNVRINFLNLVYEKIKCCTLIPEKISTIFKDPYPNYFHGYKSISESFCLDPDTY